MTLCSSPGCFVASFWLVDDDDVEVQSLVAFTVAGVDGESVGMSMAVGGSPFPWKTSFG